MTQLTSDVPGAFSPEGVPLGQVLVTERLRERAPRAADHEAESAAYASLARALSDDPDSILQRLTDVAVQLCGAHSAGISILEDSGPGTFFRWRAVSGAFAPHLGGGLPGVFAPCGVTVERDAPQLFIRPSRYYTDLRAAQPEIVEALLLPFHARGRAVGTIWILAHDEARQFDREDLRILGHLTAFASAGWELASSLEASVAARKVAEEASEARDQLLATVSHDLRTPLTSVLGWAQFLELTGPTPEVKKAAEGIVSSAKVLAFMVDDLLDASRSRTGRLQVRLEPVDLPAVVRGAVELADPILRNAGLSLRLDIGACEGAVDGDAHRLQQVLWNLLTNAMKFTRRGGEIRVSLSPSERGAVLAVTDSGSGIDPALLPRVFDRFVSGSGNDSGLGLGLWISRQIIEQHGGTIAASSGGAGRGTTVTIALPCRDGRDGAPPASF